MYSKARDIVTRILDEPLADSLADDVNDKLDQILRRAEHEIVER